MHDIARSAVIVITQYLFQTTEKKRNFQYFFSVYTSPLFVLIVAVSASLSQLYAVIYNTHNKLVH